MELVAIDNNLRTTVRTLDNNLKTLVYENYNKFISATETIKSMKQNVDKMEQDMSVLAQNMKGIDSLCSSIDSTMATRREKIDELSGVYKLLKGRQFLFELPNRLRHDLTHGQYADAVKYYLLTESVLRSYEHLPSFGGINEECKATMDELRENLWGRVKNPATAPPIFAEAVGLLVDLQSGEHDELLDIFVERSRARFDAALKRKDADEVATVSNALLPVVVSVGNQFVACFVDRPVLTSTEAGGARSKLMDLLDSFINLYYAEVQKVIGDTNDISEVTAGITILSEKLVDAMSKMPVRFGEQKVSDLVNASIRHFINRDLGALQGEAMASIQTAINQSIEGDVTALSLARDAVDSICRAVSAFLDNLQPLVDPKWTIGRDPLSVVRITAVKLAGLFTGISGHILDLQTSDRTLLLSGLTLMLEKQAVPMAKEGLAGLAILAQSQATAIDPQFRASELATLLHSAAKSLLESYVSSTASKMARLMTRSIEAGSWMAPDLPSVRRPRLVVKVLRDDLDQVHRAVSEIFSGNNVVKISVSSSSASSHGGKRAAAAYGVNNDEMARLFTEKIRIYTPVEFTAGSVVFCMVKIAVKAWLEVIRTRIFAKHSLHQMQVDAFVLKGSMARMISGEELRIVETLLSQVESSAEDRCVEPVPLDVSVLGKIAEAHAEEEEKAALASVAASAEPKDNSSDPLLQEELANEEDALNNE